MYLKALEIQGFKSFPDKTRLTFEKNITAIVGPNGSGKSNISDAILWVMGEQRSKALRGSKMEDVIFGGTEKRGALGYAQVSLIIDNSGHIFDSDSSEIMRAARPTGARSLRKPPVSPATATEKRKRSASLKRRKKTSCALMTR